MQREDDGWGVGEARDCGGPKQTGQLRTWWTEHGQWEVRGETLYQDQPRGSIAGRTRPGGDGG